MNNQSKNKGFKYGFKLGVIFSLLAQLITFYDVFASVRSSSGVISHRAWEIGFPVPMYSGWYLTLSDGEPYYAAIIINLIFAIFFSVALGLIFKFKSKIKNNFKNTAFNFGFWSGICLFIFLQYLSYLLSYQEYIDSQLREIVFSVGSYGGGFPFYFYRVVIANPSGVYYDLLAFSVDIFIALVFSFIVGLIFNFIWSKMAERLERKRPRLQ